MHASKNNPLISVIVPNYNHARYLPERLASIYNQTYKNIEVIILDDASTDNSLKIITQETKNWEIPYRLIRAEQNSGNPFKQWKKGLDLAKGQLIWIAESDDSAKPEFLEKLQAYIKQNRAIPLAFSSSKIIDAQGNLLYTSKNRLNNFNITNKHPQFIREEKIGAQLPIDFPIVNISSCLFRKDQALTFPYKFFDQCCNSGDFYFLLLLIKKGKGAGVIPEHLNYFRRHPEAMTVKRQNFNSLAYIDNLAAKYLFAKHLNIANLPQSAIIANKMLKQWVRLRNIRNLFITKTDKKAIKIISNIYPINRLDFYKTSLIQLSKHVAG